MSTLKNCFSKKLLCSVAILFFCLMSINVSAQESYPFPGRAQDLPSGHYWFLKQQHAQSAQQKFAYDFGHGIRFDKAKNKWVGTKPGVAGDACTSAERNEECIIYGAPVYAIDDGEVVSCWRNAPENPRPGEHHPRLGQPPPAILGGGNALAIDHGDGTLAFYAHMRPGTIPNSICPHNNVFVSDRTKNDFEWTEEGYLPPGSRPRVRQGQLIGEVGNSGQSSHPHLHIHLSKIDENAQVIRPLHLHFHGGWVKSQNLPTDSSNDWVRLEGETLSNPPTVILPDYSRGFREIARHGVPDEDYQFVFHHIVDSGYRPEWVQGFSKSGQVFLNAIFRPADEARWAASHNLTTNDYQDRVDDLISRGFRPYLVNSYPLNDTILYAAIFTTKPGPHFHAYHGLSSNEHQQQFDALIRDGFQPKNISVASLRGRRFITALYEKDNVGSFEARSLLSPQQYQEKFDENRARGRQLSYVNSYTHNEGPHFSAIWKSDIRGAFRARHNLTGKEYQEEWEDARRDGFLTQAVTGYFDGNQAFFAALWRN